MGNKYDERARGWCNEVEFISNVPDGSQVGEDRYYSNGIKDTAMKLFNGDNGYVLAHRLGIIVAKGGELLVLNPGKEGHIKRSLLKLAGAISRLQITYKDDDIIMNMEAVKVRALDLIGE